MSGDRVQVIKMAAHIKFRTGFFIHQGQIDGTAPGVT